MNFTHDIFNRFYMRACNVSLQLLLTKVSYLIAMIFSYIQLGRKTQKTYDAVNREYTVRNSKRNIHHILIY
jgi:hypothetical protein